MTGVSFTRVLRSEWIKFWSLRSTWITLFLAVVTYIGIGTLACWLTFRNDSGPSVHDKVAFSLNGSQLALLLVGVLGVLTMTGEYTTGTIRTTLSAVPRRLPVLAAKALVMGTVTFALMLPSALIAFTVGQSLIGESGVGFSEPGVFATILGNAAYVTGTGLLGLLLGGLLRSAAGAITTTFTATFLSSLIVALVMPEDLYRTVGKYLPSAAGEAMSTHIQSTVLLKPGPGAAVFAAYLLLIGVLAAWRLKTSDAA